MVMEPLAVLQHRPYSRQHRFPESIRLGLTPSLSVVVASSRSPGASKSMKESMAAGNLAAAEIDGVNTVLWKHKAANRLHTWRLDSNWEHISSDGWIGPPWRCYCL